MKLLKHLKPLSYPPVFIWEYLISALLLSSAIARGVANLYGQWVTQSYSQLVVGDVTWYGGSKQPDYLLLLGFVGFLFAILGGVRSLAAAIFKVNGEIAERGFRQLLGYSLLPAGIWAGMACITNQSSFEFLYLSIGLILLTLLFATGLLKKRIVISSVQEYVACVGGSLLIILFAWLGGHALVLVISRLNLSWPLTQIHVLLASAISMLLFSVLLACVWCRKKSDLNWLLQRTRSLLGFSQLLLPLCFLILIPSPWLQDDQRFYGFPMQPSLFILLMALLGLAYFDLGRRLRPEVFKDRVEPSKDGLHPHSIFSVLSPACLIGLLLYIKSPLYAAATIAPDDYHWSEFLLPWWLWQNFGHIPFWDYEPARGLVNYVPGLLANSFLSGEASSYMAVASRALQVLPFIAIGFLVLSRSMGMLPTFLALVLFPVPNNLYEIDLMLTVGICILAELLLKQKPVIWLMSWLAICIGLILFAPGQGGLFTMATFPLAVFSTYKAIREQRRELGRMAIGFSLILLLLLGLTPLGLMLLGALRYGAEQSSLNSIAYGVGWSLSQGTNTFLSYPLWELVRSLWIVVSALLGLLIYQSFLNPNKVARQRFLAFAVPLFFLTVLLIPRAAGRIDPGSPSRLGVASVWAVCLVLPIILLTAFGQRGRSVTLIAVAILGGLLGSTMDLLPSIERLMQHPVQVVTVASPDVVDGQKSGLPNLHRAVVQPAHLQLLQEMKTLFGILLQPGETYLDITSRNARYFYLGYPSPKRLTAADNMVHSNQQLRALQEIQVNPPPLVLASTDQARPEGQGVPLRTHLLYRHVAQNYIPFAQGRFILMIRPDQRDRLTALTASSGSQEFPPDLLIGDDPNTRLALLDRTFRVTDLVRIPSSWGKSLGSLQSKLVPMQDISPKIQPSLHSITPAGSDRYQVTGDKPTVTFNLSSFNLQGRNAGLLALQFSCKRRSKTRVALSWQSQDEPRPNSAARLEMTLKNGQQLVPLDIAPRWLLAKDIKFIQFELLDPASCPKFSLSELKLYQRSEVATDPHHLFSQNSLP